MKLLIDLSGKNLFSKGGSVKKAWKWKKYNRGKEERRGKIREK